MAKTMASADEKAKKEETAMAKTMASADEKAKKEETAIEYVSPLKKCTFTIPDLDEATGKAIPRIDPLTGVQTRIDGRPQYYEKTVKFVNIIDNVQKGCLSHYIVTSETPEVIKKRLETLAKQPNSSVMTKEQWIKQHNPAQYEEMKRREAAEAEVEKRVSEAMASFKDELALKDAALAEAQAQLKELEKGIKK